MIRPEATLLEGYGVRLEPLAAHHARDLAAPASDGRLWELWFTSVPDPEQVAAYMAIALGAKRDGVIRHHHPRPDGSVRDSVLYSILAAEWPDVQRHLQLRWKKHNGAIDPMQGEKGSL